MQVCTSASTEKAKLFSLSNFLWSKNELSKLFRGCKTSKNFVSLWKDHVAPYIDPSGKVDINLVPNGTDKDSSHMDVEASSSCSESVTPRPSHRAGSKRKATEG